MKKRVALEKVLRKASSMNGHKYCHKFIDLLFAEGDSEKSSESAATAEFQTGGNEIDSEQKANIFSLFNPKRPRLLLMTLNVCWIWLGGCEALQ